MDKDIYERWWKLHLRAASGQELLSEENVAYQEGLKIFDREEAESLLTVPADNMVAMKTAVSPSTHL